MMRNKKQYVTPNILRPADVTMTSSSGIFGHGARDPNTNTALQFQSYKKRLNDESFNHAKAADLLQFDTNGIQHALKGERKRLQQRINDRLKTKLDVYNADLNRRRSLLANLLNAEEHADYKNVIDIAQKGDAMKFQRYKETLDRLRTERLLEAQAFVLEKRTLQYADRCSELGPLIVKKNLIESKSIQLQQIKENAAKKESEKELDKMWYELQKQHDQAKLDFETQEALIRHNSKCEMKDFLEKQIEGKRLMEFEKKLIEKENLLEMKRTQEIIIREDNEALLNDKRNKQDTRRYLQNQLKTKLEFMAQRRKEEITAEQAFSRLAKLELESDEAKRIDTKAQATRETELFIEHLEEMKIREKEHEIKLNALLQQYQDDINKSHEEVTCKEKERKWSMSQDCIKTLDEQIASKKLEAENNLKRQKAENEAILQIIKTNERLNTESERLEKMARDQYRHDLKKQIEYKLLLRKREEAELERQLQVGLQEEENLKQAMEKLLDSEKSGQMLHKKHPFRNVLEMYDCHCPT